jgi:hypothetical protein
MVVTISAVQDRNVTPLVPTDSNVTAMCCQCHAMADCLDSGTSGSATFIVPGRPASLRGWRVCQPRACLLIWQKNRTQKRARQTVHHIVRPPDEPRPQIVTTDCQEWKPRRRPRSSHLSSPHHRTDRGLLPLGNRSTVGPEIRARAHPTSHSISLAEYACDDGVQLVGKKVTIPPPPLHGGMPGKPIDDALIYPGARQG